MRPSVRRLVLSLLLAAAAPIAALAAAPGPKPVPLSDEELDSYRGGYEVSPNLNFQFGAVVRTFEDGQLALETSVNLTQNSINVQQTAGPGVTPGTVLGPLDLAGATGGAVSTAGGTTFIQNVANGQLANIILNTASNHTFTQSTDVTVVLPGFADVQNQILHNLTGLRLSMDVASGTVMHFQH
jgi:hypothetical protein